jgi:hypothetical protein
MLARMDSNRSITPGRRDGSRAGAFRRRAVETSYWALAAVLIVAYCGAQTYGDRAQRHAFSMLFKSQEKVCVENDAVDLRGAADVLGDRCVNEQTVVVAF